MTTGQEITALNLDVTNSGARGVSTDKATQILPPQSGAETSTFADALRDTGSQMVTSIQKAEGASIAGLKGEASHYEVASSVMEAEQSLRMAVAIRDRMVQAFLEISRMQI